ncbi:MAG: PilZ domain-containing protein [Candidatus Omnitrophica bacterium]|nr:PilZ domain-containing protein [Candidatus Omnitrophota bacterium]
MKKDPRKDTSLQKPEKPLFCSLCKEIITDSNTKKVLKEETTAQKVYEMTHVCQAKWKEYHKKDPQLTQRAVRLKKRVKIELETTRGILRGIAKDISNSGIGLNVRTLPADRIDTNSLVDSTALINFDYKIINILPAKIKIIRIKKIANSVNTFFVAGKFLNILESDKKIIAQHLRYSNKEY